MKITNSAIFVFKFSVIFHCFYKIHNEKRIFKRINFFPLQIFQLEMEFVCPKFLNFLSFGIWTNLVMTLKTDRVSDCNKNEG